MSILRNRIRTYELDFVDWDGPLEREPLVGVAGQSSAGTATELHLRGPTVDRRADQQVVQKQETPLLRPRDKSGRVELELRHVVLPE